MDRYLDTNGIRLHYRNDVRESPDGTIKTRSHPEHIAAVAAAGLQIDWPATVKRITQPTLMLRAPDSLGPPEVGAPAVDARRAPSLGCMYVCMYVCMYGQCHVCVCTMYVCMYGLICLPSLVLGVLQLLCLQLLLQQVLS